MTGSDAAAIGELRGCTVIVAAAGDVVADVIDRLSGHGSDASSEAVLLIIGRTVLPTDRAMLIAAVGPLAVALAPTRRLVAIDVADDADPDAVVAAARYLAAASSTTGQVLRVGR